MTTTLQYGVSDQETAGPTDEDRVDYLRAMSTPTGGIPFRAHTIETVRWSTTEAFSQGVAKLRSQVERRFQDLVDRARASRSMTGGAPIPPRIELTIVDQRRNQAVPLPKLDRSRR